MIDIRHLRAFVALADTLHFGRAAQRLHITQPPLSRQIQALEEGLGVRLVDRHSRQVTLTAAGQRFADDARAVLGAFEQACRTARLMDTGEIGELHIGFMMHAAHSSVPALARRLTEQLPQVRLHLRETFPTDLIDGVLDGRLDAGIGFRRDVPRGIESRVIHEEPLCVVVPAGHPLAAQPRVQAQHLHGQALITSPEAVAPALRQAITLYVQQAGLPLEIRLESQLQQTIVSLVGEGLGIALVPASLARLTMASVRFLPLDDAPTIEQVLYWREASLNPALPRLLACVEAMAVRDTVASDDSNA